MPDQSDVEQALAGVIAGALYPDGASAASAVGTVCRVYRGWPVVQGLEADLVAGIAHVTVQPVDGSFRDTTRFPTEWQGSAPVCPLIAATNGEAVQFSGAAGPGIVAGVRVDGRAYAWRVAEASTPGVVAAVVASLVRADRPAELSGATVTFPGAWDVVARAVADGQGGQELRRQSGLFRVTLWCPSVAVRDQVAAFVDLSMAGTAFLDVDGWGCRVLRAGGYSSDEAGAVRAWRRDLVYRVEYPTVLAVSLPAMLFGSGTVNGAAYVA